MRWLQAATTPEDARHLLARLGLAPRPPPTPPTTGALAKQLVLKPAQCPGVLESTNRGRLEIEAHQRIALKEQNPIAHDLGGQHRRRRPQIDHIDRSPKGGRAT